MTTNDTYTEMDRRERWAAQEQAAQGTPASETAPSVEVDCVGAVEAPPIGDPPPGPEPGEVPEGGPVEKVERQSAATVLVELAQRQYVLGVTDDGAPFGRRRDGQAQHIVRMLRGGRTGLRQELAAQYFGSTGRAAGQAALADALMVLEGLAQDADPSPVHLRVAEDGGAAWVDLGTADGRCVRIDGSGWSVVDVAPVLFRRTKLTGAFPEPVRDGDIGELWKFVNIAEPDRPLVLAWLAAALLAPEIPHPILSLFAEHGSGKSSATKILAMLADPSPVPLRKSPKDAEGWVTAAAASWVVALDNMSVLPDWLSDTLCRAATGDGDVRRALYTDGDVAVFSFRRCVLVNGIDIGAMRGDFADRAVVVNLEPIDSTTRLTEKGLAAQWATSYPRIFGGLLTLAAGVMRVLPSVELGSSPRMADFAAILAAVDEVNETDGLARYVEQASSLAVDSLDGNPFIVAMRAVLREEFGGTAAELLVTVRPTDEKWQRPRNWPVNARAVTGLLKRNAPALRSAGWTVENEGTANKNGTTRWHLVPPMPRAEDSGKSSPPSPLPGSCRSEASNRAGIADSLSPPPAGLSPPGGDGGEQAGITDSLSPPNSPGLTCDDGEAGIAEVESPTPHTVTARCVACRAPLSPRLVAAGHTAHPGCLSDTLDLDADEAAQ